MPALAKAHRRSRARRGWPLLTLLGLLLTTGVSAQNPIPRGKGILVERFTRFIEWPNGSLPQGSVFVVCIQGTGETAENLFEYARSHKFKERLCEVRRVRAGSDLGACHLLYVSTSEAARLPQVLGAVADKPILTVGDTDGFGAKGVLINLYQEEKQATPDKRTLLQFEVNLPAIKRSKLVFRSQLLRLGRQVGPEGGRQ